MTDQELIATIAEKIMGWKPTTFQELPIPAVPIDPSYYVEDGDVWYVGSQQSDNFYDNWVFDPITDYAHVCEVLNRMASIGFGYTLSMQSPAEHRCVFTGNRIMQYGEASNPDFCRAICDAAIRAIESSERNASTPDTK